MDVDETGLENLIEDDDDNNMQLSSAELIVFMEEIWINEKFAPEILPNKQEIVDCVLGQISYMEKNLATFSVPTDSTDDDFKKGIHQLEVDRIRFLVTSYLRHRLEKIETYVLYTLKQEEERVRRGEDPYLTPAEKQFALKYKEGLGKHFDNVTSFCPGLPFEDWKEKLIIPNMHSFVFLKAHNSVEGVVIDSGNDDNEAVDLNAGSQMVISYNSVSDLVKKGDVRLI